MKQSQVMPTAPRSVLPPLVCLALQLAAWGALYAGWWWVDHLDLSRFGECRDVFEALARDSYVVGQFLPFAGVAFALSVLAGLALLWAADRGRPVVLVAGLGLLWLLSVGFHGILLCSALLGPL